MTDRLKIYNGALRALGERKLASLSENREPRRILDDAWDNGLVRECLEAGLWTFAMRTSRLDYDPSIEPDFGYTKIFTKPDDYINTNELATDEYFRSPLVDYRDEAGFIATNYETIYISYVSDHEDYGFDMSRWPMSFCRFVELSLALEASPHFSLTKVKIQDIEQRAIIAKRSALGKDALKKPPKDVPLGSFVSARRFSFSRR